MNDRLYVAVRRDLPWSVRVVQVSHAVANLAVMMPAEYLSCWGEFGPNLVAYAVQDEAELLTLAAQLETATVFREPDLGGCATALAWLGGHHSAFTGMCLL